MSRAAAPATRFVAAARSCNLHRPHSHRLCRIGSQVWPCPLIAASAAMPRVLDGGHGPHQAAARCVGTSRTDLGIAIVLVCSALRAGWSAGAATRCLKVTVYAFYATGARSNSSATRPDMAGWAAFWALRHRVAMRQVRAPLQLGCRARVGMISPWPSRWRRRSCFWSTSGPKGPRRRLRRRVPSNIRRRAGDAARRARAGAATGAPRA